MLPLAGLRVLDLSRLLPGPMCSWYLRGLGATVVKVEEPGAGDPLRHLPPAGDDGVGAWFSAINAGVHSVTLQLRAPADRALLEGLINDADVLIEGFRPGAMARLGLDPAELCARHPRLILASISGFGQTGPLKHAPGHDLGYVGLAGHLALGAPVRGAPAVPAVQVADLAGGALMAALQISAALYARAGTGRRRRAEPFAPAHATCSCQRPCRPPLAGAGASTRCLPRLLMRQPTCQAPPGCGPAEEQAPCALHAACRRALLCAPFAACRNELMATCRLQKSSAVRPLPPAGMC